MKRFSFIALAAVAVLILAMGAAPQASAQVSIGVNIGPAPVCPYGYFDYAPYSCAPYGYYGPNWFLNGVFLGAGPWFHGPRGFRGIVNNRFDPRHGYRGALPGRNEAPRPGYRGGQVRNFKGNERRDGNGHSYKR